MRMARVRRLIAGILATAIAFTGVLIAAPTAAAAAVQNCFNHTGGTYAAWTSHQGYTYAPGGWCMRQPGSGRGRMVFQPDGNLVIYNDATSNNPPNPAFNISWASGSNGKGATRLVFQTDGNVVIYKGSTPLWASGTNHVFPSYHGDFVNIPNLSWAISAPGYGKRACGVPFSKRGQMATASLVSQQTGPYYCTA